MASPYRRAEEIFRNMPNLSDPQGVRRRVEAMEGVLERLFTIPGTNRKVGLDVILDIIPGVGSIAAGTMGAWMLWEARNLGMSKWQIWRMVGNLGVDTALGAVPLVGDAFDFLFRSNTRNLKIIKKHLDKHHPGTIIIDQ